MCLHVSEYMCVSVFGDLRLISDVILYYATAHLYTRSLLALAGFPCQLGLGVPDPASSMLGLEVANPTSNLMRFLGI